MEETCFYCERPLPEVHEHEHAPGVGGISMCRCANCGDPSPEARVAALTRVLDRAQLFVTPLKKGDPS